MNRKFITFTTDFGVQTQGIGLMEGIINKISPQAKVLHLMHGLPSFNILAAARTLESITYLSPSVHVCVCDPGVGTDRRGIVCQMKRGDIFIGPDNGVFMPISRFLGGIEKVYSLTNPDFMLYPVSDVFHGRDVFATAAAHIANDTPLDQFGDFVEVSDLCQAPYNEADIDDNRIHAQIIQINHFGSAHLNIMEKIWDTFDISLKENVRISFPNHDSIDIVYDKSFGMVEPGSNIIVKDGFGRIALAINQGAFSQKYNLKISDKLILEYL